MEAAAADGFYHHSLDWLSGFVGINQPVISNTATPLFEVIVRNHVSAILAKLGVSDFTQAAVIAVQYGIE